MCVLKFQKRARKMALEVKMLAAKPNKQRQPWLPHSGRKDRSSCLWVYGGDNGYLQVTRDWDSIVFLHKDTTH